jgi:hypothetical protein
MGKMWKTVSCLPLELAWTEDSTNRPLGTEKQNIVKYLSANTLPREGVISERICCFIICEASSIDVLRDRILKITESCLIFHIHQETSQSPTGPFKSSDTRDISFCVKTCCTSIFRQRIVLDFIKKYILRSCLDKWPQINWQPNCSKTHPS